MVQAFNALTLARLLAYAIALIGASITVGVAYQDIRNRLSTVECQVQMLVDVVVYQAKPTQPKCK